jgi:subtilisin family serine protease
VDHLVGQVDLLLPPDTFLINSSWTVVTSAATDWRGTLSAYNDLRPGMTVEAVVRWNRYGDLAALSVESVGVGADTVTLSGTVTDAVPEIQRFRLATGELLIIRRGTPLDGDVHRITDIEEGMKLTAECVSTEAGEYQALWAMVESQSASPFAPTDYATSEALVVLESGVRADEVASRHGATIVGTLPGSVISLFRWESPIGDQHVQMLRADPDVTEVEPNYRAQDPETVRRRLIAIDRQPTSDRFSRQYVIEQSGVAAAHQRTTGSGTLVAIIDTGVDLFHPLLRHSIADGGWDFVDGDASPWETADGVDQDNDGDVDEASGHGTFVAGLVLLVAPSAKILPYRVLNDDGHGTTFAICQAVLSAMDQGADVINMSFAYDEKPRVLDRILDEASQRGIVLVSGAGNSSVTHLPFPARDHRVLAIAAVDQTGALADFTNHGSDAAIAAGGVDLYSGGFDGEFGTWSGTSMAAPLVSGTAALLRSVNPYLLPSQIEAALHQSAAQISGSEVGLLRIDSALDLVPSLWSPHQASESQMCLAPTRSLVANPRKNE